MRRDLKRSDSSFSHLTDGPKRGPGDTHLEGWDLRAPSSASFSSSLRWLSRSAAAAGHSYGSTGRVARILFHPIQSPGRERKVDYSPRIHLLEKAVLWSSGLTPVVPQLPLDIVDGACVKKIIKIGIGHKKIRIGRPLVGNVQSSLTV